MIGSTVRPTTTPGSWWRHEAADPPAAHAGPDSRPSARWGGQQLLPAGWPLSMLFLGFPLWWALGLANFALPLAACFMALHMLRHRPVVLPRGFALWALFLVWVLMGALVLGVEAPGAVSGDGGVGRYLTFGYRAALYLAATVVLVYVGNLSREAMSTGAIARLLGFMFVVTTVGGLVGSLLPPFEFRSPVELLLPGPLRDNAFLTGLVHPRTAEIQTVLGYAESRPVAPFNYANAWGANYSFFLPFFLLSWFGKGAGWRRFVAPFILLASFVPVVYSLNRGLWTALGLALVYVAVRLALSGRLWAFQVLVAGAVVGAAALLFSPLMTIIQERLANPHSNDRRAQLLSLTVEAVVRGSPVLGFGTTRNVQGSFASIAGGETAACPGCGVPPLGTQGTLWSIIFFQGLVGAALFLLFFALWFLRHLGDPSPLAIAATTVVFLAAVEMLVYDFSGLPLATIMIAIGLVWRERRAKGLPS